MQHIALSLAILVLAGSAFAQTPPAATDSTQPPSSYYPAPPPLQAPTVEKGAPLGNLSSPLAGGQAAPTRTAIDSEAEAQLFADALGRSLAMGNDADAAGLAEMRFGAGRGQAGTVLMLTLGTGIGSALFRDGVLVPNTELGHLQVRGKDAERRAAASIRVSKGLSWHAWSKRVAEYVDIIDALSGIEMCLPKAIKDKNAHINLPKGCQTLSGVDALGYVRMRYADPRGDLGRVERQREMLAAIADKAASPASVLNPVRYWNLCNAAAAAIRIGEDTSLRQVITLGLAVRKISGGNGLALTVPISNPGASTSAGSAVLWDDAKAKAMFADIARGDTSDLKKYAK